jgi:hypothetical protein
MRVAVRIAGAAALALCLGGAIPAGREKAPLAAFARAMLAGAPNNFAAIRGTKTESEAYYDAYNLNPKSAPLCSSCRIYDSYARGTYVENWSVGERFVQDLADAGDLHPLTRSLLMQTAKVGWPMAKTESYVKAQLAPLTTGFSMQRTVSSGYPTLVWRGPRHVWVSAGIYTGMVNVALRVGHDLTKSVHVLQPPSQSQLADLRAGSDRAVRTAVAAAPGNFATLRAPAKIKDPLGGNYDVTVTFGPMFRPCELLDMAARYGSSWDQYKDSEPEWAMNCNTVWMAGTAAGLEENLRSAISAALPSGFTADPSARTSHLGGDYRWNNGNNVSVAITSSEDNGAVSFLVQVLHFSPKQ